MTLIDDIPKVVEVLQEIAKSHCYYPGNAKDYSSLHNCMSKWARGSFSKEQKSSFYSKFMSHEINLFLNKRDPAFFKSVVLPMLRYKMEKQIVDFYLL